MRYEQEIKNAEKREKRERQQLLNDLIEISNTPVGLRVFDYFLSLCGIYQDAFTGREDTFYNCGKQAVGKLMLMDLEEADPRIYIKLLTNRLKGEQDDAS